MLLATTLATASVCQDLTVASSAGMTHSKWQEFSTTGSRLVTETGILFTSQLNAHLQCHIVQWQLSWTQSRGNRDYEGITNTRQPAISSTDIHEQATKINALIPLHARWFGGLGVEDRKTDRNIHSIGQALGYPEHFEQRSVLAGILFKYPLTHAGTLDATLWAGKTYPGQLWINLPEKDTTRLTLGTGRVTEASLTWVSEKTSTSGWSWASTIHWRQSRTSEGPQSTISRNGRLMGSARQPQTDIQSLGILASLKYSF